MPTKPKIFDAEHEAQRVKGREYRAKNIDKRREWNRNWIAKNRERYNASKLIYRDNLKKEAMRQYSEGDVCCIVCGVTDIDVLCLDHINNNGAEHRKELGISSRGGSAGTTTYAALKKLDWPKAGLQVLCANCNLKKEQMRKFDKRMENWHYANYICHGVMPSVKAREDKL